MLLRNGEGLLLDFAGGAPLRSLASRWNDQIAYVASDGKHQLGITALLVRPDGFVAWASDGVPDLAQAGQAAARWFGQTVASNIR